MNTSRTAIVTGYSSGLGKEIAAALLERGWNLVGVARESKPEDLLSAYESNITHISGNVDSDDTAKRAFEAASAGNLRLVVNSAGQGVFGPIGSYSASDLHAVTAGNLIGLMLFSDYAFRYMKSTGGDIVNVMSTAAKKLRTAESAYVAAKWGAKAYTRTLREAAKEQKLPIRVFEVYPCGMSTRFWSDAIRPVTDGSSFPDPKSISQAVIDAVLSESAAYCQELTFERS